ncbi:hypothetical protein [Azospirillum sp. B2RO_4]|uniref:hypothetical protein n=1 Tax=Azospirillum sp. B2RO_4 TaxID=3027796 RepID=UPI003DA9526A
MTRARSNAVVGAIKAGDILVKNWQGMTKSGVIIRLGQLFSKGKAEFTHAGIASAPTKIIETNSAGLQENNLLTTRGSLTYDVFRCLIPGIGEGAAQVATMMLHNFTQGGSAQLPYDSKGAIRSLGRGTSSQSSDRINKLLDKLFAGGSEGFFCSGHVVYCYLVAMEQANIAVQGSFPIENMQAVFGLESRFYNPSFLHKHLSDNKNFKFIGKVKGGVLV